MTYSIEQLYEANVYSLRAIARTLGVKSPTTLTKKALINEILQIESGEKQPCIPSKRGRPTKIVLEDINSNQEKTTTLNSNCAEEDIKKEFIASILKEIEKQLNKLL